MPMPVASSPRTNPSHALLHKTLHQNVKAHGAIGDGIADDTSAIQAAIDAAGVAGEGRVYVPPGNYKLTNTLTLNASRSVRLSGANGPNADPGFTESGSRIFGAIAGPLIERTAIAQDVAVVIEDLSIHNTNNAGTCIKLAGLQAPAGIYRCSIRGHIGVNLTSNIFQCAIENCFIQIGGTTYAGSQGIAMTGHTNIVSCDLSGYEIGILAHGPASAIMGGRIETCGTGVKLGTGGDLFKGSVSDINFEACDTAVKVQEAGPAVLYGLQISGTAGSPSGGSLFGIDVDNTFGLTVIGCGIGGNATADIRVPAAAQRHTLTFIGCTAGTWSVTEDLDLTIINSDAPIPITRTGVIATASLPAAATKQNGRLIIEDNGAGDRNLIIYAGGQRFRIDGGAAF